MNGITTHVTVLVDKENSRQMVETRKVEQSRFDRHVFKTPKDYEYTIEKDGEKGIIKATSFFHTERGERWLLEKMEKTAEAYQDIQAPSRVLDVNWWRSAD
jgi:hypothetical protein